MKAAKAKIDKAYFEKIMSLGFNTGAKAKVPQVKKVVAFAGIIRIPCGPKGKRNDEEAFSA